MCQHEIVGHKEEGRHQGGDDCCPVALEPIFHAMDVVVMLWLFFLFLAGKFDKEKGEDAHEESAEGAEKHDDGALGIGFLVGGGSLVEPEFVGDVFVGVDLGLGGAGLHGGELLALVGDELSEGELVLGMAAEGILEGEDFLLHLVADALHDGGSVDGASMVDAVAEGVVVASDEVGHVGCPLWVDVEDGDLDAEIFGALDGNVGAIGLVEFEEFLGVGGADAIVLHHVEMVAHVVLHGLGEEDLDGVFAVALDAIVHEIEAIVMVGDGLGEAVGIGGEKDGRGLVAGCHHEGGDDGDGDCQDENDDEELPPAAEEVEGCLEVVVVAKRFLFHNDAYACVWSEERNVSLFIVSILLHADGVEVDAFVDFANKLLIDIELSGFVEALLKFDVPLARLIDGDVVGALDVGYLLREGEPGGKQGDEFVVDGGDLLATVAEGRGGMVGVRGEQEVGEDSGQLAGSNLLLSVGEGAGGGRMALYHEAVEVEIECTLGERLNHVAATAEVARVAEERKVGQGAAELDGDFPTGVVAEVGGIVGGEAAMDGCDIGDAHLGEALEGTHPKLDVGHKGVLHHDGDIGAAEGVAELGHGEGIARGAGANPQDVDAVAKGEVDMMRLSDLDGKGECAGNVGIGMAADVGDPAECLLSCPFETAGTGARFPHSAADERHFWLDGQGVGNRAKLVVTLSAAGACDDKGGLAMRY